MKTVLICWVVAIWSGISMACKRVTLHYNASLPGDEEELHVVFHNVGGADLTLYWVDFQGKEVKQGFFASDQVVTVTSYVNHVWRVRTNSHHTPIYEVVLQEHHFGRYINVGKDCFESDIAFSSSSTYSLINEADRPDAHQCTTSCDVSPWLSKYVEVPGYHVVCLSGFLTETGDYILSSTFWADGYRVVEDYKYQDLLNPSWNDFRFYAEKALGIRNTDYRVATALNSQSYAPLPWAIYDTYRHKMTDLQAIWQSKTPAVYLIFEGGAFIYPGIDLDYQREVNLEGFPITLTTLSIRPLVFSIESFLTEAEREYIITNAGKHMKSSEVSLMDHDKGKKAKQFRTSQTYFMSSRGHPLMQTLDLRTANLTGMPIDHQEDLQVLKYEAGQYYLAHADYWDPVYYKGDDALMQSIHGGFHNRLATVFWYLNDCFGGYTAFPSAPIMEAHVSQPINPTPTFTDVCPYDFRIQPKAGSAILFYSMLPSGEGDSLSLHTACRVQNDLKWAANKWVWNYKRQ